MTAVADTPVALNDVLDDVAAEITAMRRPEEEVPAAPAAEEAPEPETPAEPKPRSRGAILLHIKETLKAQEERMVLARRLCMGYERLVAGDFCNSGTQDFLAHVKLHPPGMNVVDLQYHREPEEKRLEGEAALHRDVWKAFGEDEDALGDFTVTGLQKRLDKAVEAHEKWAARFREHVIQKSRESYIRPAGRTEMLNRLGMEPFGARRRFEWRIANYQGGELAADTSRTTAQEAAAFRERLVRALRAEFGDAIADEASLMRITSVNCYDI